MNVASAMIAEEIIHLRQRLGNVRVIPPEHDIQSLAGMRVIEPQAIFGSGGLPGLTRNGESDRQKGKHQ